MHPSLPTTVGHLAGGQPLRRSTPRRAVAVGAGGRDDRPIDTATRPPAGAPRVPGSPSAVIRRDRGTPLQRLTLHRINLTDEKAMPVACGSAPPDATLDIEPRQSGPRMPIVYRNSGMRPAAADRLNHRGP